MLDVPVASAVAGEAGADVAQVRAGAHGAEVNAFLVDVVAGDAAALAPAALDVGAVAGVADLLGVAVNAAEVAIDLLAADGLAGEALREGLALVLVEHGLKVGVAEVVRQDDARPAERDGEEDAEED